MKLCFFSTWNEIIRNDVNNLFFYGVIEVKPIYKVCIIRFEDYTVVCKSVIFHTSIEK